MHKSAIEYLHWSWNPITGCLHTTKTCPIISDCWARSFARRFSDRYSPGFHPTIHWDRIDEPFALKKPARIGVSFMGDMFGPRVYREWQQQVLDVVRLCQRHTFVFLTKAGEVLPKFNPWPTNAWVGVSITGALPEVDRRNLKALKETKARVRWVSFEPLLGQPCLDLDGVSWTVVGGMSGPRARQTEWQWVADVLEEAGKRGIALWMKRNLPQCWQGENLIQEFPHV